MLMFQGSSSIQTTEDSTLMKNSSRISMNFGQAEEGQKRLSSLTDFATDPYCTTALTDSTIGRDNAKYIFQIW